MIPLKQSLYCQVVIHIGHTLEFFFSEKNNKYDTLTVLRSNPELIPQNRLYLLPILGFNTTASLNYGFGVYGCLKLTNRINYNIGFKHSIYNPYLDKNIYTEGMGINGLKKTHYFETGIEFKFKEKKLFKLLNIHLSQLSGSHHGGVVDLSTKIPSYRLNKTSARMGIIESSNFVTFNNYTNGFCLNIKNNKDSLKFYSKNQYDYRLVKEVMTMYSQFGFYIGIETKTSTFLLTKSGFGTKGNTRSFSGFFDIAIMPKMKFDDFVMTNRSGIYKFVGTGINRLGFRVGTTYETNTALALLLKAEVGAMPSFSQNEYLALGIFNYAGLTVGLGITSIKK